MSDTFTEYDGLRAYCKWVAGDTRLVEFTIYEERGRVRTARTIAGTETYRVRAKQRATPSASFLVNVAMTTSTQSGTTLGQVTGNVRFDPDDITTYPLEVDMELVRTVPGSADADTPSGYVEEHILRWLATVYQATTP